MWSICCFYQRQHRCCKIQRSAGKQTCSSGMKHTHTPLPTAVVCTYLHLGDTSANFNLIKNSGHAFGNRENWLFKADQA